MEYLNGMMILLTTAAITIAITVTVAIIAATGAVITTQAAIGIAITAKAAITAAIGIVIITTIPMTHHTTGVITQREMTTIMLDSMMATTKVKMLDIMKV